MTGKNRGKSWRPEYLNLFVPFLMLVLSEWITGNLPNLTPAGLVLSLVVYAILYAGVFFLAGTTKLSWLILSLLIYGLAVGEYFVISFRERPAMIWDVLALRTAMTVSANYHYAVTLPMVLSLLGVFALGIFSWMVPLRISGRKKRAKGLAAWTGGTFAFGLLLFGILVPKFNLKVPMWDPIVSFEHQGFLLSTVLSFESLFPDQPEGYGEAHAEALLKEMEAKAQELGWEESGGRKGEAQDAGQMSEMSQERTVPVNVICIMNESFSDLRIFNGLVPGNSFETDRPFLSFFDSLEENVQKGWLYMPVFGAMTANSEYEFLTGNSCAFVPQGSIPYQFYTRPGDTSLARTFREHGYRTVAMHPYPGYNWNRTQAYENLGFEEFLDQEYYDAAGFGTGEGEMPRGYLSDQADYQAIIRQVEEKTPGEKLFLFNVTMQNHGGYEVADFPAAVYVSRLNGEDCRGEFPKAEQYLTLMELSDEALAGLLAYFSEYEEPTMVVLFGDHQPSVETSFYEALYGTGWSEVPAELKLHSFVTPYLVWTNYDRETEDAGDMSAFMLGNLVLQEAGLEPDGFRYAVEEMGKEYPVVHSMGLLTGDHAFLDVLETGTLDVSGTILDYHTLQYYRMFEEKPE